MGIAELPVHSSFRGEEPLHQLVLARSTGVQLLSAAHGFQVQFCCTARHAASMPYMTEPCLPHA